MAAVSVSRSTLASPAKHNSLLAASGVDPEFLGGMVLMMPSSVDKTGASSTATIGPNGSVTFGSCETLSLNGVFTTDYDNYMVVIRHEGSTTTGIRGRLRDSTPADASGSNYVSQLLFANGTGVSASRGAATTDFSLGDTVNGNKNGHALYVYGPFLAQPTAIRSVSEYSTSGAGIADYASTHSLSNSYVGLSIILTGGATLSGLVSVYGLVGT
jgi:hypothetical protein